eukprot:scaffold127957_cov29-Tisochrysis_lutea.AAC.1
MLHPDSNFDFPAPSSHSILTGTPAGAYTSPYLPGRASSATSELNTISSSHFVSHQERLLTEARVHPCNCCPPAECLAYMCGPRAAFDKRIFGVSSSGVSQ